MSLSLTDRIYETKEEFKRLQLEYPRQAAEVAYVLAKLYRNACKSELAAQYARKSIDLFESVPMDTLEDAAAHYTVLADVCLPSYIHQDVVRQAFPEYHL